uniref:F-box domain-containing protein n=1 Tax=Oryza glumipatula TaxID=40148 RepID=A0A0D9YDR9_9ORYZ
MVALEMCAGVGVRGHELKHGRQRHEEVGSEVAGDGVASLAEMDLYGDVLESVVERVPAADLAASARVSREWLRAVRAALRRRPRRLPWLVVHLHGRRRRTAAYDPHSGAWVTVPAARHDTPSHVRLVRGAGGDRVCALSLSGLAVSGDPLGKDVCVALKAPGVWRVDPVFAAVGDRVVALGGACQLALGEGEDASVVEVHESGSWTACGPMPAELRESAAATWLSVAATDQRVYLTDRSTGWASWFDPAKQQWGPTCRLRPDATVSTWGLAPGRGGAERLVLFGAKRCGRAEQAKSRVVIQAWEVDGDGLALSRGAAHDTMPGEMSERLFPRDEDGDEEDEEEMSPSIGVCGNAAGGYVYNAADPAIGAVLYELRDGVGSAVERWEWVPCAPSVEAEPLGRFILACSPVGLDELARGQPAACTAAQ